MRSSAQHREDRREMRLFALSRVIYGKKTKVFELTKITSDAPFF
jgi:hypothetical protein